MSKLKLLSISICCLSVVPAYGESGGSVEKMLIDDAKVDVFLRYRLENVDQDRFIDNARASTLRSTLDYKTGTLADFSAVFQLQNVLHLGNDDFNDTINGKTNRPTIADPEVSEVTQAFLSYSGLPNTSLSIGRKIINFDNRRFINVNNWRQHAQSFDSISLINKSFSDTAIQYVYIANVNRSNGSDHRLANIDSNHHLVNINYSGWQYGKLTGYGYLLDFDRSDFAANSSKTFGLRFIGNQALNNELKLLYTAEYARQSDYGDNQENFNTDYLLTELAVATSNWSVKLGYEVLAADGNNGRFTTPLGTNHGFHGWADQFGNMPATGLKDLHLKAQYKLQSDDYAFINGLKIDFRYHDFSAEQGSSNYGDEFDIRLSKTFKQHYSVALMYVDYDADEFSTDTKKAWLILAAKF